MVRDGRDSNSQRPAWQAGALTKLNYHPNIIFNNHALSLGFIKIAAGINTQYPNIKIMGASLTDW